MTAKYDLERDLLPIMEGKVALPNAKPIDDDDVVSILHYRDMHPGRALLPNGHTEWSARYFLDYGKGGQLYGTGIVAWSAWRDGANRVSGYKFAICEHEPKADAGANPSRGWNPAHCAKCGLDMTVDSGD